jgi:hypothetical protein
MNVDEFLKAASPDEVVQKFADLASATDQAAVDEICQFLPIPIHYDSAHPLELFYGVSRLACRALLQKGELGIKVLGDLFLEAPLESEGFQETPDVGAILEALWHAAYGRLIPIVGNPELKLMRPLDDVLSTETIDAARQAFNDILEESQLNEELFQKLMFFLLQHAFNSILPGGPGLDSIRSAIFEVFTEPTIKITRRLIGTLEKLIGESQREEAYQQFLASNPVFLDPLASEVIPKQRLGLEYTTDYVVRRLDNEYILVEIEKPQDALFTANNDFTAKFTHAYGQILDFQQWVDSNAAYARTLLPKISSPKGLLIIGLRKNLTDRQKAKLERFCFNNRSVDVLTFDDLVTRGRDLYANIYINVGVDRLFQSDS